MTNRRPRTDVICDITGNSIFDKGGKGERAWNRGCLRCCTKAMYIPILGILEIEGGKKLTEPNSRFFSMNRLLLWEGVEFSERGEPQPAGGCLKPLGLLGGFGSNALSQTFGARLILESNNWFLSHKLQNWQIY